MSSKARPTEARGEFEAFRAELERDWPAAGRLTVLGTVDSTNSLARRTLEADSLEELRTFVAWQQSAGRGRLGRGWSSPAGGGIYASVLLPLAGAGALEILPLLLPVTACEALRALGVGGCAIKWPNDLLAGGRKLGGLLIEAVAVGSHPRAAILGLGINYRAPRGSEFATRPVGLVELVERAPTPAGVARRILDPLLERLSGLEELSVGDLIGPYRELSAHAPGERVACRTAAETVEGGFAGFDDRGFLRLRIGAAERRIGSGEIVEH